MSAFASTLIYLMALGTVLLDAAIVVKVFALFHRPSRAQIVRGGRSYGLLAIFILSALSIAGTLFMQYAGALPPCVLCWWQRIFMYPIAIISLIAFIKNAKLSDIADYVLALSFLGALVALYQHLLQVLPQGSLIPCDATNDCAVRSVFYFNFVTIPWMALTVFAAVFLIAFIGRRYRS
ncbi:MAG TPA: disulfide bond formation protein B [Candidatus Paceibacterota bacterium]|nr:disulfide bond formation protein B [Candidatus Paceibacterota bacterium]